MRIARLLAVLSATFSLFAALPAIAQQPVKNGITVAPAFVTLQVGSVQPQATASIGVKNDTDSTLVLEAVAGGLGVQENTLVLGGEPEETLRASVTISPATLRLNPGQSQNIQVTVSNSDRLSPGGHYLSILMRQTASSSGQLSLDSAVSATVFVIKEDGAVRKLSADSLRTDRGLFRFPSFADITFQDDGNVAAVPRGLAEIRKSGSDGVRARGVINEGSVPVFPGQELKLRTNLDKNHPPRLPGKYVLSVQFRYEGEEQLHKAEYEFWYVPKAYIFALAGLIALTGWALMPAQRYKIKKYYRKAKIRIDGRLPERRPKRRKKHTSRSSETAPDRSEQVRVRKITDIHKKQ